MHPEFIEGMLAERVNDLRRETAAAHRAAQARRHRHARRDAVRQNAAYQAVAGQPAPGRAPALSEMGPEQVPAEPVGAATSGCRAA